MSCWPHRQAAGAPKPGRTPPWPTWPPCSRDRLVRPARRRGEGGRTTVTAVNLIGLIPWRSVSGSSCWSPCCSRNDSDERRVGSRAIHRHPGGRRGRSATASSVKICSALCNVQRHNRVERTIYRLVGVNSGSEQNVGAYTRSVLASSATSILFLYALQRLQGHLWLDAGLPGVESHIAGNTAVSFVTNTNWQAYPGESTMTYSRRWPVWRCRTSCRPPSVSPWPWH